MANDTEFGLVSYIWSDHLPTVMNVSEKMRSGIVWVNTPLTRELRALWGLQKFWRWTRRWAFLRGVLHRRKDDNDPKGALEPFPVRHEIMSWLDADNSQLCGVTFPVNSVSRNCGCVPPQPTNVIQAPAEAPLVVLQNLR